MTQSKAAASIFEQYKTFVEQPDILTALTLKGHLAIESVLDQIIGARLSRALVADARLTFHQKLCLAQALSGESANHVCWDLIKIINKLRNDIAHNLTTAKSSRLLNELRNSLRTSDPEASRLIPAPDDDRVLVSHAVSYVIGALGAYHHEIEDTTSL